MLQGGIFEPGPKEELFTSPHHEYTDLLIYSVPEMDPDWLTELLKECTEKGIMYSMSSS